MTRFVIIILFIVIAYSILRYAMSVFRREMHRKSESGESRNWKHVNTEEEYRQILGITTSDTPETIRKKYKELLAKYHPDKVQHLGIEFQEIAEKKTRDIMEAYEFFRKKHNP
jgi:DnaJ-domain-containing protein 1